MEETSKEFKQTKLILETKEFNFTQLKNFFNNISKSSVISDSERETLIEIIENQVRTKFPKQAKTIFGKKDESAIILLEEILSHLSEEFDWSKNKVKTKVKTGGDHLTGKSYIVKYISYKNESGINVGLRYVQLSASEDPCLIVRYSVVGKGSENEEKSSKFSIHEKEDALQLYKNYLTQII